MTKSAFIVLLALQCGDGFAQEIKFDGVPEGRPLKRGSDYQIYLTESLSPQIVSIQFRKNDLVAYEGPGFLKSGKYGVHIPTTLKGDYLLMVVDPATRTVLKSGVVSIERKLPLVLQIIAIVGITLAVSFI